MLAPGKITEELTIPLASQTTPPRPRGKSPNWLAVVALTIIILIAQGVFYICTQADISGETLAVKSSAALPHFSKVHDYLYRGGAPTADGLAELKKLGVKTVIDFRLSGDKILWERMQCAHLGINYISLPTKLWPSKEAESTFMTVVDQASKDADKAPVFIHCAHGSDRTSYAVALWRVKHDGWSIPNAFVEMLKNGFLIHRFR
jgi:hypothetical protein